jgi:uncharacterized protein
MESKKLDGEYIIDVGYNGKVEHEGFYSDGKRHGTQTDYYENGNRRNMWSWDMGVFHGLFLDWREDGTKKEETWYLKGKEVGPNIQFYKNGRRKSIKNFKNGKIHGKWTTFYKNGKRKNEINYENGEQVGLVRKWFKTGNIKYRGILRVKNVEGSPYPRKWYVNEERWWDKNIKKSYSDQRGPIWEDENGNLIK